MCKSLFPNPFFITHSLQRGGIRYVWKYYGIVSASSLRCNVSIQFSNIYIFILKHSRSYAASP